VRQGWLLRGAAAVRFRAEAREAALRAPRCRRRAVTYAFPKMREA